MAGQGKSRKRLIRELLFLQEQTTPEEPINIEKLQSYLGELSATRQIIYADFKEMEDMGFGIHHKKNGHYYYDRQSFTMGELTLMTDLVCCAGYPDVESARKLLLHIKQMGNMRQFDALSRHENLAMRNKTNNPFCIDNTKLIHESILNNKMIIFRYAHTDRYGKTEPDKSRIISPYQLVWNNSRLYLLGGLERNESMELRSFRVDKIYELKQMETKRRMLPCDHTFYSAKSGINAEKFLKATFDMFSSEDGKTTRVTFCVANRLVGSAIDQFGQNIHLKEYDAEHMQFTADVQVSNMFFGWLARFDYEQMRILKPTDLIERYKIHLQNILKEYT